MVASHAHPPGDLAHNQACAVTGKQTGNPLVFRLALNHWATPARADNNKHFIKYLSCAKNSVKDMKRWLREYLSSQSRDGWKQNMMGHKKEDKFIWMKSWNSIAGEKTKVGKCFGKGYKSRFLGSVKLRVVQSYRFWRHLWIQLPKNWCKDNGTAKNRL